MYLVIIRDATRDAIRDVIQDVIWNAIQNIIRDAIWNAILDAIQNTIRDVIRDAIRDGIQDAIWDAIQNTIRDATRDAILDVIRNRKTIAAIFPVMMTLLITRKVRTSTVLVRFFSYCTGIILRRSRIWLVLGVAIWRFLAIWRLQEKMVLNIRKL